MYLSLFSDLTVQTPFNLQLPLIDTNIVFLFAAHDETPAPAGFERNVQSRDGTEDEGGVFFKYNQKVVGSKYVQALLDPVCCSWLSLGWAWPQASGTDTCS